MNHYISSDMILENAEQLSQIHIPISYVDSNIIDLEKYFDEALIDKDAVFYTKGGYFVDGKWYDYSHKQSGKQKFFTHSEVEKMSKRYLNVVNPDDLCERYGADTFRMYEMFLGPVEMSKPWDTKGIEGVHRFLKKLWRLFFDETKGPIWTSTAPSPSERAGGEVPTNAELKILHKTIKKIEEDTERFSFNTGVSTFMICVNELTDLKCHKKEILEPLLILLAPYAPHIAEELYDQLGSPVPLSTRGEGAGGEGSILAASFPKWEEKYIKETSKAYPVAINGKTRAELTIALDATQQQVEELVLQDATVQKWLDGKTPKKMSMEEQDDQPGGLKNWYNLRLMKNTSIYQ
jgi:leucyl-tRNA synthetase